jgi:hypothetical protein
MKKNIYFNFVWVLWLLLMACTNEQQRNAETNILELNNSLYQNTITPLKVLMSKNKSCQDMMDDLYKSQSRYNRLSFQDGRKPITAFDVITFENKADGSLFRELKYKVITDIEVFQNCNNPTTESKNYVEELKKAQKLLELDKTADEITLLAIQSEYEYVQKLLESVTPDEAGLKKLKLYESWWFVRPIWCPKANTKMKEILDIIHNKQSQITHLENKKLQKQTTQKRAEIVAKKISKINALGLPSKVLNATIYAPSVYGVEPHGNVKENLALLLNNPDIKNISAEYKANYKKKGYNYLLVTLESDTDEPLTISFIVDGTDVYLFGSYDAYRVIMANALENALLSEIFFGAQRY